MTNDEADYCVNEIREIAAQQGWEHLSTDSSDRSAFSRYLRLRRGECYCTIRISDHQSLCSTGCDIDLRYADYTEHQVSERLADVMELCA